MKALQQLVIRSRSALRAWRARRGGAPLPGHLVLRLDDFDAPGPVAGGASLDDWQGRVVDTLGWLGVVPTRVIARASHPLLADLARFANRLECPVTVRTGPEGLDDLVALALVDAGVRRVIVAGTGAGEAIAALSRARRERSAVVDLVVEVPAERAFGLRGEAEEVRAAGADGIRLAAPWEGGPWRIDVVDGVREARAWVASFHRSDREALLALPDFVGRAPGTPRARGRCPVAGLRLELGPDGRVCGCPWKAGAVPLAGEGTWEALAPHRAAIVACDRACWHPELR